VDVSNGESPYACAIREAFEELDLKINCSNLHLAGLISEQGFDSEPHWLMFLFEITLRIDAVPPPHPEGEFRFFSREDLYQLEIPQTDRETIWPLIWKYQGGFFSAHCQCGPNGQTHWTIEETRVQPFEEKSL
jgi:8-oxo-dGTP diphosphatase